MKKIDSFTINHLTLLPGVYVSRVDRNPDGTEITTYDIRMTAPNREPSLSIPALHAIEHLAATYLRNREGWNDDVIYWGPMGCCTGNYLILRGAPDASLAREMMIETFSFIRDFEGEIPGATPKDCGNYLLMNLPEAKMAARKYLAVLESDDCPLEYPL